MVTKLVHEFSKVRSGSSYRCFESFNSAVREVAALCLALNYPTAASVPHSIMDAYKNMLAIGMACKNYSWENLEKVETILKDPSAFAAAAAPAGMSVCFFLFLVVVLFCFV